MDYEQFDAGIRSLVMFLHQAGHKTIGSCQGGVGHPMVTECRLTRPGAAFVTIVATDDADKSSEFDVLLRSAGYDDFVVKKINQPSDRYPHGYHIIRFSGELKEGQKRVKT